MAKLNCREVNSKGERCRAYAGPSGFCFMHDPAKGKERSLARRNGGRSTKKPHIADSSLIPDEIRTIDAVFTILNYTLQETIILDNSVHRGRLLVSIAHGFIEALKVGELEKRMEALEMALKVRTSEMALNTSK